MLKYEQEVHMRGILSDSQTSEKSSVSLAIRDTETLPALRNISPNLDWQKDSNMVITNAAEDIGSYSACSRAQGLVHFGRAI